MGYSGSIYSIITIDRNMMSECHIYRAEYISRQSTIVP